MALQENIKYKGLTKKQFKRIYGSSTAGKEKGENCHATGLDKAMAKYPRAWKTNINEYINHNIKKHSMSKHTSLSFFNTL